MLRVQSSKLPFVFSNFAMTADGKIAFANREFIPFSSQRDREHMMELRATADAVIAGARTVEAPRVTLGPGGEKFRRLRLARGLSEYNLRVIVSGSSSVNPRSEIFRHRFSPILVLTAEGVPRERLRQLCEVADEVKIFGETRIDFPAAFRWLREKWNVKRLLCEGGGGLHAALVRAGLINELHLTICPKIFGGRRAPTIAEGSGFSRLAAAEPFRIKSARNIGDELFTVLERSVNPRFR
jgi:2,5-diamino-6-(ribosylamino)-4(3H)-pyrimidinone 5'-phosphate reductase